MRVNQPVGVVQMTNVAIIKYKTNNQKLEICCYKNKAINWRNGVEKNLEEVLQVKEIFKNATKGDIASKQELEQLFGEIKKEEMIKIILEKGDLQIGDRERQTHIDQIHKDIVKFIQEKCVHAISEKPLTPQSIEFAISKVTFVIKTDQNVKRQALQCIKKLREQFFIKRAAMQVKVTYDDRAKIDKIIQNLEIIKKEEDNGALLLIIDPSIFRALTKEINQAKLKAQVEVVEAVIQNKVEGLEDLGAVELDIRKEKAIISDSDSDHDHEQQKKTKKQIQHQKKHHQQQQQQQQQFQQDQKPEPQQGDLSKQFKCTTCITSFDTNPEFRTHYKTDWHNFNVKQKSQHKPILSSEEFVEHELNESLRKL